MLERWVVCPPPTLPSGHPLTRLLGFPPEAGDAGGSGTSFSVMLGGEKRGITSAGAVPTAGARWGRNGQTWMGEHLPRQHPPPPPCLPLRPQQERAWGPWGTCGWRMTDPPPGTHSTAAGASPGVPAAGAMGYLWLENNRPPARHAQHRRLLGGCGAQRCEPDPWLPAYAPLRRDISISRLNRQRCRPRPP